MSKRQQTIGVLTSGGDAPGMNAAIRAVVRTACDLGHKVKGIRRGFTGLLEEDFVDMDAMSVSDIISRGGTIHQDVHSSVPWRVSSWERRIAASMGLTVSL